MKILLLLLSFSVYAQVPTKVAGDKIVATEFNELQNQITEVKNIESIRYKTTAGYGSGTNSRIAYFTEVSTDGINYSTATDNTTSLSSMTCTSSSTLGLSCTINTTGLYMIVGQLSFTGAEHYGIGKNGMVSQTISDLNSTNEKLLAWATNGSSGWVSPVVFTGILQAGDVVRLHSNAQALNNGTRGKFEITRVK